MALIPAHRRYLGPVILVLLALLMAGSLIPDPTGPWRPFTVPPGMPLEGIIRLGQEDNEPNCLVEGVRRVIDREVRLHFHRVVATGTSRKS